jgi:hypothetical protein
VRGSSRRPDRCPQVGEELQINIPYQRGGYGITIADNKNINDDESTRQPQYPQIQYTAILTQLSYSPTARPRPQLVITLKCRPTHLLCTE